MRREVRRALATQIGLIAAKPDECANIVVLLGFASLSPTYIRVQAAGSCGMGRLLVLQQADQRTEARFGERQQPAVDCDRGAIDEILADARLQALAQRRIRFRSGRQRPDQRDQVCGVGLLGSAFQVAPAESDSTIRVGQRAGEAFGAGRRVRPKARPISNSLALAANAAAAAS